MSDAWVDVNPRRMPQDWSTRSPPQAGGTSCISRCRCRGVDPYQAKNWALDRNRALTRLGDNGALRTAVEEDLDELQEIASESHHDSRFYVDGNFSRSACDELYRIWIANEEHQRGNRRVTNPKTVHKNDSSKP
jgi:hypothetical protein